MSAAGSTAQNEFAEHTERLLASMRDLPRKPPKRASAKPKAAATATASAAANTKKPKARRA